MAAHRYWRARFPAGGQSSGSVCCAECRMFLTNGGANVALGQIYFGSVAGSFPPPLAFDNNVSTFFTSNGASTPTGGHYIGVDFGGSPQDIKGFEFVDRPDGTNQAPLQIIFESSDDNITYSTFIDTGPITWQSAGQTKAWNTFLPLTQVAQYPLLGVFQPTPAPQVQIAQYPLLGVFQPTPTPQVQVAQMVVIGVISNPHFGQIPQPFGLPCWSPCQNVIYMKGEIK